MRHNSGSSSISVWNEHQYVLGAKFVHQYVHRFGGISGGPELIKPASEGGTTERGQVCCGASAGRRAGYALAATGVVRDGLRYGTANLFLSVESPESPLRPDISVPGCGGAGPRPRAFLRRESSVGSCVVPTYYIMAICNGRKRRLRRVERRVAGAAEARRRRARARRRCAARRARHHARCTPAPPRPTAPTAAGRKLAQAAGCSHTCRAP